jgi:hypothetical protein
MDTLPNSAETMMVAGAQKALRFLGYGDPKSARIWFVGLEESRAFERQSDFDILPDTPFKAYEGCRGEATPVYVVVSKIVTGLLGQNWNATWREYRDRKLFHTNTQAVLLNLYPLGKGRLKSWPKQYFDWFKMTRDQYYSWVTDDKSGRFPHICTLRNKHRRPLTVCFGTTAWVDFRKCFTLTSPANGLPFEFHQTDRIVLTPFFRHSLMPDDRIRSLIEQINARSLNPFQLRGRQ